MTGAETPVAIVTDSCHYLPSELVAAADLHEVSLYVHSEGATERESELTDYEQYYRRLAAAGELPRTSQPSIGDFLSVYEPLLARGREIVSIHLSGGLSGTCESARQARAQLEGAGAERITIVDSSAACGAEGAVLLAAAAAARAGRDAEAVAAHALGARAQLRMWFCVDTLEYLRRGGRIGGARAWLGSTLRIKPILTMGEQIAPVERVRTDRRAFARMIGYMHDCVAGGIDGWIVQHIQAPERAAELVTHGREIFGSEPLFVSEIGPVIGTHIGPGLYGVGGLPRSWLEP